MLVSYTTILAAGCPFPTQLEREPEVPNQAPVIDSERTRPYVTGGSVAEGTIPRLTLVVDDPNPADRLVVKVIKNLWMTLDPESTDPHIVLLSDFAITPDDIVDPGGAPTVRVKESFPLAATPCPAGSAPSQVILDVCVSDREYQAPSGTDRNPCLPGPGGFVDRYYVSVACVDAGD
jgi:hypothetical protein